MVCPSAQSASPSSVRGSRSDGVPPYPPAGHAGRNGNTPPSEKIRGSARERWREKNGGAHTPSTPPAATAVTWQRKPDVDCCCATVGPRGPGTVRAICTTVGQLHSFDHLRGTAPTGVSWAGRGGVYEDACTQVPGAFRRPNARCNPQAGKTDRPGQAGTHTQRSHRCSTPAHPQEQGSCPDRDATAASILLFPIVDFCFGRHPDQTHTCLYLAYHLAAVQQQHQQHPADCALPPRHLYMVLCPGLSLPLEHYFARIPPFQIRNTECTPPPTQVTPTPCPYYILPMYLEATYQQVPANASP